MCIFEASSLVHSGQRSTGLQTNVGLQDLFLASEPGDEQCKRDQMRRAYSGLRHICPQLCVRRFAVVWLQHPTTLMTDVGPSSSCIVPTGMMGASRNCDVGMAFLLAHCTPEASPWTAALEGSLVHCARQSFRRRSDVSVPSGNLRAEVPQCPPQPLVGSLHSKDTQRILR